MKRIECADEATLGEILELPESDPRRVHIASCPRCRALAMSYEQFLAAAPEAGGRAFGPLEDAVLTAFRERMFAAPVARAATEPPPRRWWTPLVQPAMRPAWAITALALVAGSVLFWPRTGDNALRGVVRGGEFAPMALGDPRFLPGGGARLTWHGSPEAERYEIRFYSTAFAEVGRISAGIDTTLTLMPAALPAAYRDGGIVLYRVHALRGPDEVAASPTGTLRRP